MTTKTKVFFTYFFCQICMKTTKMVFERDHGKYEFYRCEECHHQHSVAVR